MDIKVFGNNAQLPKLMMRAQCEVSVEGRGTGKSFDIGFKMDELVRSMPGGIFAITGKSFGQLLTRTLPSSLKLLNQIGYQKDINYVIGKRPPSWFKDSIESINKYDNIISFSNGCRFAMISQSEPGSGRGANCDYEIADEALLLDREQYTQEVSPTNRGNLEFFGKKSKHPVYLHHGFKYSTSMPVNKEGRWILEFADYYKAEKGILLFETWNMVVQQQLELLELARNYRTAKNLNDERLMQELKGDFTTMWNQVNALKNKIKPFVSKEGVLFTLSNAFDNLSFLGMDYLLDNQKNLPSMVFLVEIMNMYIDKVEDCFYNLQDKHIYYGANDDKAMMAFAKDNNFNYDSNHFDNSTFDNDCESSQPLEVSFDWGSSICLMCVFQEKPHDMKGKDTERGQYQTQINEFFVKPDESDNVMIESLINKFCNYYNAHANRMLLYYKDKYGDHRNPNVLNSQTYNERAISLLKRNGWQVIVKEHRGMEPPQSDKHMLWQRVLAEHENGLPKFRINGDKCKYTIVSMNNAKVKNVEGQLKKDKSSERPKSGVLPEEATHFSDAVDKLMWTKYGEKLNKRSGGMSYVRFGKK